ncbi:CBS domain-containing protein [Bacillus luteolus]|uniref:CBS domain-containing protein n=1 Tax=Litchfieldia luteola TaxID=682179 RepID=A0ABR9QIR0_9BACI|nr:acetoin utilization AcuB family protein [Cytobacillus luteolus]MBE4908296.1 CBS domain-containing protein [Cytobacillus luteolus]MBP1943082.1 acetoin utilization protein AcuB [Cytobacillus luteolus]
MIVEQIMKKNVFTLSPKDTIATAVKLLEKHKIRHIPILDEHQSVVGIISDRDVRDANSSIFRSNEHLEDLERPVETIMTTDVITGHPLDFVEEISAILYEHNIGCLPITKGGKLVGIVTETDLLHTLVQLTGANQPGSQIEIKVSNKAGMLSEVATIIGKRNVNISSVLVYPDQDERYKILVFRVQTMNPMAVITDLKNEGYQVLWPNMPGISS